MEGAQPPPQLQLLVEPVQVLALEKQLHLRLLRRRLGLALELHLQMLLLPLLAMLHLRR